MINKGSTGNGVCTNNSKDCVPSRQVLPPSPAADHDANAFRDQPQPELFEPPPRRGFRVDWQMVALRIFIAASFAALAITGYLIWAKCRGVPVP